MLDHISIAVKNYENSQKFYDETLKILGYERITIFHDKEKNIKSAAYGKNDKPFFWISTLKSENDEIGEAAGLHIAFLAPNSEMVNSWHRKCLEMGGRDNGAPGPREGYQKGFYSAYIIDPDNWRIEACCYE